MFEIKIQAQTAEEVVDQLRALVGALSGAGAVQAQAPAAPPAEPSRLAPQPQTQPEQPPAPAESTIRLEDIRPLLVQLNQQQGREATKELLGQYGADRLTGVDPKHYPDLLSNVRFMLEVPF